jgi:Peptidase C10 family/Spi protease inhibitor
MRSRSFLLTLTTLTAAHLAACAIDDEESSTVETTQETTSRNDTIVPPAIARAVAEAFTAQDGKLQKHVDTVTTMLDASGRTALYGVNFVEGGYVVISAELNLLPILAFSDEGTIDFARLRTGEDGMIGGLRGAVEAVRTTAPGVDAAIDEARAERIQWQPYLDQIATRADVPPAELAAARLGTTEICFPGPCTPSPVEYCKTTKIATIGPLMTTYWSQGCNFNDFTPAAANGPCGHTLVGCTAVAAGQLMKFHKRGIATYYNFDMMPNGAGGTPDQLIMRNFFLMETAVAVKMKFGATASSAYAEDVEAMLDSQGYNAYRYTIPFGIANTASTEIKEKRPLLMDGINASNVGHMWVVDGHKEVLPVSPAGCKLKPNSVKNYFNHNFGHGVSTAWYADLKFGPYVSGLHLMSVRKL